jgi:hypothetical protein
MEVTLTHTEVYFKEEQETDREVVALEILLPYLLPLPYFTVHLRQATHVVT